MEATSYDFDRGIPTDAVGIENGATDPGRRARSLIGQEVSNLIADVQDLIGRIGSSVDPEIAQLRTRIERAIESTKKAVTDGTAQVQKQAKDALSVGDRYVRNSPWQAIGIAAAVGLVVGLFSVRR
jgi:ElaB/YqjD/DUF883 family membrane-anchored ribosome-binding protein